MQEAEAGGLQAGGQPGLYKYKYVYLYNVYKESHGDFNCKKKTAIESIMHRIIC
jgi:hypothetical protein